MQKIIYYHTRDMIRKLPEGFVLVVGTNTRGAHGAGSAKDAFKFFGAVYGQPFGLQGRAYGIPTRIYLDRKHNNTMFEDMPLPRLEQNIKLFFKDAQEMPELTFVLTRIGCGRAGYDDSEIAPLFRNPLSNIVLPYQWLEFIKHDQAIQVPI